MGLHRGFKIGCEESVAVHDDDRARGISEQRARAVKPPAGPQKFGFPRESELDAIWAGPSEHPLNLFWLRVRIRNDLLDSGPPEVLHRKPRERPIGDRDDGFWAKVGERPQARAEPGC
jgi:hypothetical protein